MKPWLMSIERLKAILSNRHDLRDALETSIAKAALPEVADLQQFYDLLHRMLTRIPVGNEMGKELDQFHYITSSPAVGLLREDEMFHQWLAVFANDHGSYLDSAESASGLESFIKDPAYRIEEYDAGPSGWLTFNQFFTRRVKGGQRPVAGLCDDRVIVSATDSVYMGCWPIDPAAAVTAKGTRYSISQLLDGSPYAEAFAGGVFTHSYLSSNDYHHYHMPVSGIVKEVRKISGHVIAETEKQEDGTFTTKDEVGFQFRQTRGIAIIESVLGLVAIIPVGMGHVSSVNFTVDAGIPLAKGEELGYFAFGGSDMILLFQAGKVELTAVAGVHYKQGTQIGQAISSV
jgi:phosphatidylserine decarboxylase